MRRRTTWWYWLVAALWACGQGSKASDLEAQLDNGLMDEHKAMTPDPAPDGGSCPHMDCGYYSSHYAWFSKELRSFTFEECKARFATFETGCLPCCTMSGEPARMVVSQWCCPPDAEVSDAAEGES